VSDHWLPISPVSGRLDAFEWKDPLAGEDHGAVIEHRADAPPAPPATIATPDAARAADAGKAAAPGVTSPRERGEVGSRSDPGEGGAPQSEMSQPAPHPHPLSGSRINPTSAANSDRTRVDPSSVASGERERARQADKPAQQADKPASEEKEKAQRAAEEAAHPDPFSAGGRSGRRAMAAATAAESRAARGRAMTPVVPAVIPLVHAPDDPGPNGEAELEPAPEPAPPPADGWSRIRALFRP